MSEYVIVEGRRAFARTLGGLSLVVLEACDGRVGGGGPDGVDARGRDGGAIDPGRDGSAIDPTRDGGSIDPRRDGGSSDGGMLEWIVTLPVFVAGVATPFDLASTLPASVVRGGVFSIDPMSAPLPAGMELTREGLLSSGTASPSSMDGVVFAYEEP